MKPFTLTLCIAAATLFAIPSTTFAEDQPAAANPGRPAGERHMAPEARLKLLTEKLGLDADQQAQIKAIYEKNAPKFKEIMAKGWENLTDADRKAMRDLFMSQIEEVNALLRPEQLEKIKELRQHRRAERKPDAAK